MLKCSLLHFKIERTVLLSRSYHEWILKELIFDGFGTRNEAKHLGHLNRVRYYELQQIAHVVIDGGIWLGEDLLQFLIASLTQIKTTNVLPQHTEWRQKVSHREAEVIESVALGATNKAIARQLDISERTVKAHLTNIFEKLGVTGRFNLALLVNGKLNYASLT